MRSPERGAPLPRQPEKCPSPESSSPRPSAHRMTDSRSGQGSPNWSRDPAGLVQGASPHWRDLGTRTHGAAARECPRTSLSRPLPRDGTPAFSTSCWSCVQALVKRTGAEIRAACESNGCADLQRLYPSLTPDEVCRRGRVPLRPVRLHTGRAPAAGTVATASPPQTGLGWGVAG